MGGRVVFAGSPDFAVPSLQRIADDGFEIALVLTQPDRPAGRGRQPRPSPVKQCALTLGLELRQPATLKDGKIIEELHRLAPDVIVVVAYGLLLPGAVLSIPRAGCVNVHASLLPRWRGAAPIQMAVLHGDTETGVSIMRIDEGLDTGPVYACRPVSIGRHETAGELHDRLAVLGAKLLSATLPGVLDGSLEAAPQPEDGATHAGRIRKADALIDWTRPAAEIDRQIRAYNPWPVAETRLDGRQLRCWKASPANDIGGLTGEPGEIVGVSNDGVLVMTGEGVLCLTEIQRAGRRRSAATGFARGHPVVGKRLDE